MEADNDKDDPSVETTTRSQDEQQLDHELKDVEGNKNIMPRSKDIISGNYGHRKLAPENHGSIFWDCFVRSLSPLHAGGQLTKYEKSLLADMMMACVKKMGMRFVKRIRDESQSTGKEKLQSQEGHRSVWCELRTFNARSKTLNDLRRYPDYKWKTLHLERGDSSNIVASAKATASIVAETILSSKAKRINEAISVHEKKDFRKSVLDLDEKKEYYQYRFAMNAVEKHIPENGIFDAFDEKSNLRSNNCTNYVRAESDNETDIFVAPGIATDMVLGQSLIMTQDHRCQQRWLREEHAKARREKLQHDNDLYCALFKNVFAVPNQELKPYWCRDA
ncbi:unnamed protein product [Pseudo-nitzschia multistriata]|uniref:Uncharacterized protein n=1 Tax=Pseudo-nitzschia multistriata TaxID=183589 RepID=A0A448Z2X2_9STRA|nr:unnamed protein product [Pseudo-nitzschia multistriata]